jgi:hypothetical protein
MSAAHHPLIDMADYESFRTILGSHIPDTYDKWLDLRAKWEQNAIEDGFVIIDVKIDPDQFRRFRAATGSPANMNSLTKFTILVAEGHVY